MIKLIKNYNLRGRDKKNIATCRLNQFRGQFSENLFNIYYPNIQRLTSPKLYFTKQEREKMIIVMIVMMMMIMTIMMMVMIVAGYLDNKC